MHSLRILFAVVGALGVIFPVTAAAENGDIVRPIYSTDILTYMDGIPIRGYSLDGEMMICLEDLEGYGFSVYYNDEARTLFVNKTGRAAEDFAPLMERGKIGDIVGYTYETDIKAYVNGQLAETENIGGRLVTIAENLADTDNSGYIWDLAFDDFSKYFITYNYDDNTRTLSLYSNNEDAELYQANIEKYDYCMNTVKKAQTLIDSFSCDDYDGYIHRGGYRDLTNWDACNAVRFYKSGRVMDYEYILQEAYSFRARYGPSITDARFSEDGRYLEFEAERTDPEPYSLMSMRHTFEQGEYKLDMDTCALIKIDTEFYGHNTAPVLSEDS